MDFDLDEGQQAVRDLAAQILDGTVAPERLRAFEIAGEHVDRVAWKALADANLVGIAIPEEHGGSGLGFLEACLVLEQIGRHTAPVPYYASVVLGALPLARFGTDAQRQRLLPAVARGELILTAALLEAGAPPDSPSTSAQRDGDAWFLTGTKDFVASGLDADHLIVSATTDEGPALFLIEAAAPGVARERQLVTNQIPEARVVLDRVPAEPLAGDEALRWTIQRATAALCATAIGVLDEAVRLTATYTTTRQQFAKPISSFQAVTQRAADAYIDAEAVRLTTWQAVWRLAGELPSEAEVATAKFWAADGGQRVAAAAQHLHGGIGVDRDYPLHRHFLWAKWIQLNLGGANQQLRQIGRLIAATAG